MIHKFVPEMDRRRILDQCQPQLRHQATLHHQQGVTGHLLWLGFVARPRSKLDFCKYMCAIWSAITLIQSLDPILRCICY